MRKILLIGCLLLLVGCQTQDNSNKQVSEDIYDVAEEIIPDETVEESVEDNEESEPELKPLKRETVRRGGTQIIPTTPFSLSLEAVSEDNNTVYSGTTPGMEYRKTYTINISGQSEGSNDILLTVYDRSGDPVWDETITVDGVYNESVLMTMTEKTQKETTITATTTETVKVESITISRLLGASLFADEFDVDGLPDEDAWDYDIGGNGWGNGELQYYTNADIDNARVEDGQLIITAMDEQINNNAYSSARLKSKNSWTYGRFEIKATLPYGRGTWPAIWMLPSGNQYGNWPNSGEIDIMEHVGFDMDVVHASLHMAEFNFRKGWHPTAEMMIPKVDTEAHVYTLEWSPYQIDMYIDDYHYLSFKNKGQGSREWPYDQNFFLLLNIAVGGGWGAQQGVDPVYPQEMVIDYVRVYEMMDELVDVIPPNQVSGMTYDVNGAVVDIAWAPVEDNYLVDHYVVRILDETTGNIRDIETTDLKITLMDLESETDYTIQLFAVDESGLMSESLDIDITTGTINYQKANVVIPADETYLLKGINYDEGDFTYLNNIEKEDVFGYAFDLDVSGSYQLEFEMSGNIFEGLIEVTQMNPELLTEDKLIEIITPKTGGWDNYETVISEPFDLRSGQQVLTIHVLKNGFRVKSAKLVKVD